jgi:oligoribonuclease
MTGLDTQNDLILEIASIVTDNFLNIIATGPNLIIHQPKTILDTMGTWCLEHHKKSGLYAASLESTLTVQQAEEKTLSFLQKYCQAGTSPLCGNSIHHDKTFLKKDMPTLANFFHYRLIDVSTLKELAQRWQLDILPGFQKKEHHRALDDILESIEELRHYKKNLFHLQS